MVGGPRRAGIVHHARRLVEGELRDLVREAPGRVDGENGSGGDAVHARPAAGRVDDRFEVLHLAGHGVREGIPAVAAPAPVVVEDGVVHRELGGQLDIRAEGAAAEGPVDDHHGRAVTGTVVGDEGPVTRDRGAGLVPGCGR
jgi:hypothetical protein